jgi:ABC-type uncharacterized transport system permease subunit
MMRYLRLLRLYAANSLQLDLEYRADFAINIVTALISLGAGWIVLDVMFTHAESFGGWTWPCSASTSCSRSSSTAF